VRAKKAVMVGRAGSFGASHVNLDMIETARGRFSEDPAVAGQARANAHRDPNAQTASGRGRCETGDVRARAELLAALRQ